MDIFGNKYSVYLPQQRRIFLLAQELGPSLPTKSSLVPPPCTSKLSITAPPAASPGSSFMSRPPFTSPVTGHLSLGHPPTPSGLFCLYVHAFSSAWNSLIFPHIHFSRANSNSISSKKCLCQSLPKQN